MKILGLVGGISWVSTIDYYRYINEAVNKQLGGLNYAECIIYSLNYAEVKKNADAKNNEAVLSMVTNACMHLKQSGAGAIVLCANTMHMFAEDIERQTGMPLIHIAAATANEINKQGLRKVGLLGTIPTMEMDFYKKKLADKGIEAIVPEEEDRTFIHASIFGELGKGIINEETKKRYLVIMDKLVEEGAEGIILGCTEIPLLIKQADVKMPVFDTTRIHAEAASAFALSL